MIDCSVQLFPACDKIPKFNLRLELFVDQSLYLFSRWVFLGIFILILTHKFGLIFKLFRPLQLLDKHSVMCIDLLSYVLVLGLIIEVHKFVTLSLQFRDFLLEVPYFLLKSVGQFVFHLHPLLLAFLDCLFDLLEVFVDLEVQLEPFLVPEVRFLFNHL